jgi:hypothetical protein
VGMMGGELTFLRAPNDNDDVVVVVVVVFAVVDSRCGGRRVGVLGVVRHEWRWWGGLGGLLGFTLFLVSFPSSPPFLSLLCCFHGGCANPITRSGCWPSVRWAEVVGGCDRVTPVELDGDRTGDTDASRLAVVGAGGGGWLR